LLVQEFLKRTPKDHPDHKDLEVALQKILTVASEMNSAKRDAELLDKVAQVQRYLIYPEYSKRHRAIVTTIRRYVREAKLEVIENGERSPYNYVFLFNDAVIFTRQKQKGNMFHLFFYLKRLKITEGRADGGS
jgi:hypothetical protein